MARHTLRTRIGLVLSALALCSGGPGAAPALATMARWTELGPPTTLGPVVYDTRRHRALLINGHSIWSVSDGSSTWTKLWEGFHPPGYGLGFVYEPQRDRLWAFSTNNDFTGQTGASVSYMELGATDLAWTPTTFTGTAPYKLVGYAAVFDPVRDRVVVFGGLRGVSDYDNRVWVLDLVGTPAWSTPTIGDPPVPRWQVTGVYDPWRDRMVFFGGTVSRSSRFKLATDETWALSLGPSMSWSLLPPRGAVTRKRSPAIVGLDSVGQRMIVTGGTHSDVWALDLSLSAPSDSATWRQLTADSPQPPVRKDMLGWVDPTGLRLWRYGGLLGSIRYADFWSLDLASAAWTPLAANAPQPTSWQGHVAFSGLSPETWFVVSGDLDSGARRRLERSERWNENPAGAPLGRHWASAVRDDAGGRALFVGGNSSGPPGAPEWDGGSAPFFSFSFYADTWTRLVSPHEMTPRADALALFDTARRRLIVHGGRYGGNPGDLARSDTWVYDVTAADWSRLPTGDFGGRWSEAGIYDPVRDRLVVFGGMDALTAWSDVHVLPLGGGGSWATLTTSGTPPPIVKPRSIRAAYDTAHDRMIVVAGDGILLRVYALSLDATPTWSEVAVAGGPPRGREEFAAAVDAAGTRMLVHGGLDYPSESWVLTFDQDAPVPVPVPNPGDLRVSLAGARPNPALGQLMVRFSLASADPARLEMFDAAGRFVLSREVGHLGAGAHVIVIERRERPVGTGVYFLRLTQGRESRRARVVILE